jgi:hypothetical protein
MAGSAIRDERTDAEKAFRKTKTCKTETQT